MNEEWKKGELMVSLGCIKDWMKDELGINERWIKEWIKSVNKGWNKGELRSE